MAGLDGVRGHYQARSIRAARRGLLRAVGTQRAVRRPSVRHRPGCCLALTQHSVYAAAAVPRLPLSAGPERMAGRTMRVERARTLCAGRARLLVCSATARVAAGARGVSRWARRRHARRRRRESNTATRRPATSAASHHHLQSRHGASSASAAMHCARLLTLAPLCSHHPRPQVPAMRCRRPRRRRARARRASLRGSARGSSLRSQR